MAVILESAGILIGMFFMYLYAKELARPARFLTTSLLISASSWMAEESAIRLYRFYEYDPGWHFVAGNVPLLVIVIWPVIITSALDLVSRFNFSSKRPKVLAGAAIVATDALFIEPLSASAGLWQWRFQGIFSVPPIGILGWFFFAFLAMLLLENERLREKPLLFGLLLLPLPVIGTHLLLLLAWWGALRWIHLPLPQPALTGAVWCLSFLAVCFIHKKRVGRRIRKRTLLIRLPAAFFFFSLILYAGHTLSFLLIYALAFVPPYIMIMVQQYQRRHRVA